MNSSVIFVVFLIFIPILVLILLLLNLLLAVHKPYSEKVSIYECGFLPMGEQTRGVFDIKFFLIAVLFLAFDCEILLAAPIVVSLKSVDYYGLIIAILFFVLLTFGFIYELGKDALNMNNVLSLNKNTIINDVSLSSQLENSRVKNLNHNESTIFL